jgi:nucleoid-associated protein YgaU
VAQLQTGPAPAAGAAVPPPATPQAGEPASADKAGAAGPRPAGNQLAAASLGGRELPTGTVMIPDIGTTIVSRGDNLWRISQRIYGKGLRYTVIYGANQGQIRNPNRIYPGQVFVIPGEEQARQN